ncbi:MAG: DUF2997 domain-containing protein [Chloroflexi bacterium]|nr:DUF2997 domain-containing protein [Chloroflexota bacterium]
MPEIEFRIDPATGKLELQVKGIIGPACDDITKIARELLGDPGQEQNTSEYYVRPQVRTQTRPRGG